MSGKAVDVDIDDLKFELGSECCGAYLYYENDDIGICGACKEWSNYNDITEENVYLFI